MNRPNQTGSATFQFILYLDKFYITTICIFFFSTDEILVHIEGAIDVSTSEQTSPTDENNVDSSPEEECEEVSIYIYVCIFKK